MDKLFFTFSFAATFRPTPAQKVAQTMINIILVYAQLITFGYFFGLGFNFTS